MTLVSFRTASSSSPSTGPGQTQDPAANAAAPLVYESVSPGPVREARRSTHIPALDGLRGLAILLVLLFHFSIPATNFTGLKRAIVHLPGAGWVGVDLFFVLSGFLITTILYDAKSTKGFFRNFYMRRVLRIFPLYYGVLFVAFVLVPLIHPITSAAYHNLTSHQVWLWAYLTNYVQPQGGSDWIRREYVEPGWSVFTHFWSLAVEEQFYLVWPAIVFFFSRRTLMAICGVVIAAALAIRIGRAAAHADLQLSYYYTFCRMDALAAGALLALASRGARGMHGLTEPAKWIGMAAAAGLLTLFVWGGESFSFKDKIVSTAGFSLLAWFFASVLVWAVVTPAVSLPGRFFNLSWLKFLGKYSYGLYVLHGLLHPALDRVFPIDQLSRVLHSSLLGAAAHLFLAAGISLIAAMASWHLYEKHFLKLKRFFEYRSPTLTEPISNHEPVSRAAAPSTSAPS
jgi:peptidoglycan/LPS O-acetylase OafA/YrhL